MSELRSAHPHIPAAGLVAVGVPGVWLTFGPMLPSSAGLKLLGSSATPLGVFLLVLALSLVPAWLAQRKDPTSLASRQRLGGWMRAALGVVIAPIGLLPGGDSTWLLVGVILSLSGLLFLTGGRGR